MDDHVKPAYGSEDEIMLTQCKVVEIRVGSAMLSSLHGKGVQQVPMRLARPKREIMKRHWFAMLLMLATVACSGGAPNASRWKPIRELVRERESLVQAQNIVGRIFGLREIIEWSSLTIEGVVARAESALREGEGEEYVYTDYLIDVSRTFRAPGALLRSRRYSPLAVRGRTAAPRTTQKSREHPR